MFGSFSTFKKRWDAILAVFSQLSLVIGDVFCKYLPTVIVVTNVLCFVFFMLCACVVLCYNVPCYVVCGHFPHIIEQS